LKKILKSKGSNVYKEFEGNFQIFAAGIASSFNPHNGGAGGGAVGIQWRKIKRQENM
jgi:hypothetical protein